MEEELYSQDADRYRAAKRRYSARAAHIFAVAFVPHFNRNGVIATAAIGVGAMSAGALLLPIAASERHRYKKTIRIALGKEGL